MSKVLEVCTMTMEGGKFYISPKTIDYFNNSVRCYSQKSIKRNIFIDVFYWDGGEEGDKPHHVCQ